MTDTNLDVITGAEITVESIYVVEMDGYDYDSDHFNSQTYRKEFDTPQEAIAYARMIMAIPATEERMPYEGEGKVIGISRNCEATGDFQLFGIGSGALKPETLKLVIEHITTQRQEIGPEIIKVIVC